MRHASRLGSVLSLLGALIATAIAMGLVAAGLLLPAVGAAGSATNGSIKTFNDIPSDIDMNPLAQQSRILAADGSVLATPFNQNRIVVSFSKISKYMKQAQVAIEDKRFYEHGALDSQGLVRAIGANIFSSGTQGASTLTQQYVKVMQQNQALSSGDETAADAAVSRSGMQGYVRKLQQLKYAITIEQKYSKDQILDGYLNLVYYGGQAYGVEAAARHYFGVHASKLSIPQAALLAGLVNQPGALEPTTNPTGAKERRDEVLTKMYQQKYITYTQMTDAKKSGLGLNIQSVSGNSCASSKYPYFCYYVINWLETQKSLGKTPKARLAKLQSGGLTVKTSFQPKLAKIIDKQIRAKVPENNSSDVQSAGVIVQPGTGLVLGSGQNTTYSNSGGKFQTAQNLVVRANMGGGLGFQIGSTQKLFAVVNALENGWTPSSTITLPNFTTKVGDYKAAVFTPSNFSDACGLHGEDWTVRNDTNNFTSGQKLSLTDATAQSVNTAFAELVSQLGACKVKKTTTELGVLTGSGKTIGSNPASIVLGTSDVAPVDVASAYATIASGGVYCPPRPVVSILDSNNKKMKLTGTSCKRVMSKKVAAETTQVFESVLTDKSGTTEGKVLLADDRPAAGKTGTTNSSTNLWFAGYTPQMATALWIGHQASTKPLKDITLAGTYYDGYLFGGTLAAPIWKNIMDEALKGKKVEYFEKPDGTTPSSAAEASSEATAGSD